MVKRKSGRKGVSRRVSNRKHSNDISYHTLTVMVILVLVVSVLSATMYVYAFYDNDGTVQFQKSSSVKEIMIIKESGAVSGAATIKIIRPPEEN